MCLTKPFLNWEETKTKFPSLVKKTGRGEYIVSFKMLYCTGIRLLSPCMTAQAWTPGTEHTSTRSGTELLNSEITLGEITLGFHTYLVGNPWLSLRRAVYHCPKNRYCFLAYTAKKDFISCGIDNGMPNIYSIVSKKLFLSNVYFVNEQGRMIKKYYSDKKCVPYI